MLNKSRKEKLRRQLVASPESSCTASIFCRGSSGGCLSPVCLPPSLEKPPGTPAWESRAPSSDPYP